MRKHGIDDFIALGFASGMLAHVTEDRQTVRTASVINRFLKLLDNYGLTSTRRCARSLEPIRDMLSTAPKKESIGGKTAKKIRKASGNILTVLSNESPGQVAYFVTEKRLRVDKLLDDIGGLFAPNVFSRLPEISREDLADAGQCIAFELPTPAASMLLRGTEAVLRHFYCSCVRQQRRRVSKMLWFAMIDHLKRLTYNPPPKSLLDEMHQLRQYYRNPTQHPERRYTLDEVQDLFSLCVNVINQMASHPRWKS